jgi:hypothetical protein
MPVLLMDVPFGKLMTVDEVDPVDMPLLQLVLVDIAVVVVTVPDVEESVVDVRDGVQPMPSQDDVEVEVTGLVVGEPEVTGEVKAGWLEVVGVEVVSGQPIPIPSSPSHDDDDDDAVKLVVGEPELAGALETG